MIKIIRGAYTQCIGEGCEHATLVNYMCNRVILDKRHVSLYTRILLDFTTEDEHDLIIGFCKNEIRDKFMGSNTNDKFDFRGGLWFMAELYRRSIQRNIILEYVNVFIVQICSGSADEMNEAIYEICEVITHCGRRLPRLWIARNMALIMDVKPNVNNRTRFRIMDLEDLIGRNWTIKK
jgi:hypothetical protein